MMGFGRIPKKKPATEEQQQQSDQQPQQPQQLKFTIPKRSQTESGGGGQQQQSPRNSPPTSSNQARNQPSSSNPGRNQPSSSNQSRNQPSTSSQSRPPPVQIGRSTDRPTNETFNRIGQSLVQTNYFKVHIANMPICFTRLSMETHLCGGKIDIKLSEGIQAVQGGVNVTERRLALQTIFRKIVQRKPDIFGTDTQQYAFDCATTIFVAQGFYKGRDTILKEKLSREDFSEDEWRSVSRIIRRKNTTFKVIISSNGVVYTRGELAEAEKNRQELTRLVEIITSQVLNTPDFFQYGSETFPFNEAPIPNSPDPTVEIRSGFDKGIRYIQGKEAPQLAMLIDTKLSPFYSPISVLKFVTSKFAEIKGNNPPSQQRPGDRGGRPGFNQRGPGGQQQRHRSRSRSPIGGYGGQRSPPRDDYNSNEVEEVQRALNKGYDQSLFRRIEDALKGLYVTPTHLDRTHNRNIIITKLSPSNAIDTQFEMNHGDEKKTVTVNEYFYITYNYKLKYPHLPLVITGRMRNQAFFPMELLRIVPGQRLKVQKMSANVQASMTGNNATLPRVHVERINLIWTESLKLDNNSHLRKFGITVEREAIRLTASMISPPLIRFGDNLRAFLKDGSVQFQAPNKGKFVRPARIEKIAVVVFDGAQIDLHRFCSKLHEQSTRNGINAGPPNTWIHAKLNSNDISTIKSEMERYRQEKVTLLMGITPEKKPDVHDVLKYFEASLGLQTQQICANTASCFTKEQGGKQTVDNVMRKFNLKCGGVNFNVEIPERPACSRTDYAKNKLFEKTQFIGIEMTHGSARSLYDRSQGTFDGEPTIVGVSCTLKMTAELGGFMYFQERNEYKLKNLDTKLRICLDMYRNSANRFPETIVLYRTGAGEGDYQRVQEEIEDMKTAIGKIPGNNKPKLVVVVVQKTSHVRIFPGDIQGEKAYQQNVKSGTVIDGEITTAGRDEFILISQTALIGTARPIKYTIMLNKADWTKNELIHVTYFLAFAHQVSYQPPAIPHVLYGAENLAKRGRNNYLMHKRLGELNVQVRNVIAEHKELDDEEHQRDLDCVLVDNITEAMNHLAVNNKNFWA